MEERIKKFDAKVILWARKNMIWFARVALFVVFFWFGILKVVGLSPAGPLVRALYESTVQGIAFDSFYLFFGYFEMVIGSLFLVPKLTRTTIILLFVHMMTTFMPLFFLKDMTWQQSFVPTMEGQYIIKNLLIIALGIVLLANTKPLVETEEGDGAGGI